MLADLRRPGRVVPIVQQSGLCGFVSRPRAPGAPLIIFPRPKQLGHVVHRLPSLREWQKCIPYTMKGSSFDCRYVTTLVFETATRPKSGWGGPFVNARISGSSASVIRWEELRVGKGGVSTDRTQGGPYKKKK